MRILKYNKQTTCCYLKHKKKDLFCNFIAKLLLLLFIGRDQALLIHRKLLILKFILLVK